MPPIFSLLFISAYLSYFSPETTVRDITIWHNTCQEEPLSETQIAQLKKNIHADEKSAKLDELFQKRRKAGFNGSVLIAEKGVILYEKTFGYASQKDTLNDQSAFQLASLSKPFTALAVLKLYEDGKLSLDDSLRHYFPELPYKGVTIKDMLSHRSGLPNYMHLFADSLRHEIRYPTNSDVIRWFVAGNPAIQNQPDRRFSYNNTNYLLLASIVEKVSKQSFESYLDDKIFKPLNMAHSFAITNPKEGIQRTIGHQYKHQLPKDHLDNVVGDKGIYSTSRDIYAFSKALLSYCILKPSTLEEAFTPRSFEKKGLRNYGYGFRMHVTDDQKVKYIYHGGWWKGYNTMWWVSRKEDFVVIILSNHYNRTVYQMKEILDILHREDLAYSDDETE